jgi:tRNA(Arg) A34 adenosine deaminase TadA
MFLWDNVLGTALYTSLEPCLMCMGAAALNLIPFFV